MKRLFLILMLVAALFIIPKAAMAGFEITFVWNANVESDLAGYKIYQSEVSNSYPGDAVGTVPVGTETITLSIPADGTYYWILTAYDVSNNESAKELSYGAEVTAILDSIAPGAPTGVSITVIVIID